MTRYEKILEEASLRCDGTPTNTNRFMSMYSFTTENIGGYLDHFDLKGKSLLTVGSSGDQAINAIFRGAKDITIFDINMFVRYYYYLKAAAILTLDRDEFDQLFFGFFLSENFDVTPLRKDLLEKIKPTLKELDPLSCEFWTTIFDKFHPMCIKNRMFNVTRYKMEMMARVDPYLTEEGYKMAKSNIGNVHISFVNQNVLSPRITKTYDNIWLSNISAWISESTIRKMFLGMRPHLNEGGEMLFSYIYGPLQSNPNYAAGHLNIVKELLADFQFEMLRFRGITSYVYLGTQTSEDCVLIHKKP